MAIETIIEKIYPQLRFAYSPLIELTISYQHLRKPQGQTALYRWVEEAHENLQNIALPYMDAVILPHKYIADFLTPTPTQVYDNIEDEFERVRKTPDDVMRKNIKFIIEIDDSSLIRERFLTNPREALECLIEELRYYWTHVLAGYWPRINAILENDLLYRARQHAVEGPESLFGSLDNTLSFAIEQQKLVYSIQKSNECKLIPTNENLQLVPSIFSGRIMHQFTPEWTPMIIYTARGHGLWQQARAEPEEALRTLIGDSRSRILQLLVNPMNTGELAHAMQMTSGAISQHLGRLSQAGMVESLRSGNRVYYRLSQKGEALLALFVMSGG